MEERERREGFDLEKSSGRFLSLFCGWKAVLPLLFLGLWLIGYAAVLLAYTLPVTGGTDQNGYHVQASVLAKNGVWFRKISEEPEFVGHMWVENDRAEFYPKYPPVYPAMLAALNVFGGEGGGFFGTALGALLAVAGMYMLVRCFLPPWYALAGSMMLGISPVFTALGVIKNSHTPSIALGVWGLAFLCYGSHRASSRSAAWLTFLAGILMGAQTGIRYTDFLLLAVPSVYLLLFVSPRNRWRLLAFLGLGAALPLGFLAIYHTWAYGAFWRTGYLLTEESGAFHVAFFFDNLRIYLPEFFTSVIGPMGIFALAIHRVSWKRICFWCSWLIPTGCLYLCYYWAPAGNETGTMRFWMPLLPAFILLSLLGLRFLTVRMRMNRKTKFCLFAMLAGVELIWGVSGVTRFCERHYFGDLCNVAMVESCRKLLPEGAVVFASPSILNELDFEQRWNLFPSYLLLYRNLRHVIDRSLGVQAAGLQKSRARMLERRFGKKKSWELTRYWQKRFMEWNRQNIPIYFLGRSNEVNALRRMFYRQFEMSKGVLLTGEAPAYVLLPQRREASRYQEKFRPKPFPVLELVRLGRKREKDLSIANSEFLLREERRELLLKLNPGRSDETRRDLEQLGTVCNDLANLRYSAQRARERSAARAKAAREKAAIANAKAAKIKAAKEKAAKEKAAKEKAAKEKAAKENGSVNRLF